MYENFTKTAVPVPQAGDFLGSGIARHDNGQQPERIKFLSIIFGCPKGKKMAHLLLLCFCIAKSKNRRGHTCGFSKEKRKGKMKKRIFVTI